MSRYAQTLIEIGKGVELKQDGLKVHAKGPKGELSLEVKPGISLKIEENNASVLLDEKSGLTSAFHGLFRSLINNMVIGVDKGFEKRLTLIGVGYRAAVAGNMLDLQVGFSHPTKLEIPQGIEVKVEKSTTVIISGADKQAVGQFAATARAIRPPEPYKGKGIRYEEEYVRKKAGKTAKG